MNTETASETARVQYLHSLLTEREREVLKLLAQGATSKESGQILGISHKTVEAHREKIKIKLQVDSIAELVQCAICFGLIEAKCPGRR